MCVHRVPKRTSNVLLSFSTLCPWDRVSHWTLNEAGQPVASRDLLVSTHPIKEAVGIPGHALHFTWFLGALPSSPHAVWWGLLPPTIPPTPEKQSCIGHYINIDGIYTLGPLFNAKNQLESHIHKDTYSITLSVEVAIRDGIVGSIHHAVFITTECCSMFKRLRDGKLELSSWFESSERFCCMRNTRFPEVCT